MTCDDWMALVLLALVCRSLMHNERRPARGFGYHPDPPTSVPKVGPVPPAPTPKQYP